MKVAQPHHLLLLLHIHLLLLLLQVQLGMDVQSQPEFQSVFGEVSNNHQGQSSVQCAEVRHTSERSWWRLVGRRHDVLWWAPDRARGLPPLPKHPAGNFR
jgi:hypothetical protein